MTPSATKYRAVAAGMFAGAAVLVFLPFGLLAFGGAEILPVLLALTLVTSAVSAGVATWLTPWMVGQALLEEPGTGGTRAGATIAVISWLLTPVAAMPLTFLFALSRDLIKGEGYGMEADGVVGGIEAVGYLTFCGFPFLLLGLLPGCAPGRAFYQYVREKQAFHPGDTTLTPGQD